MTRYLLDTNILDAFAKSAHTPLLTDWLRRQPGPTLHIASFTLAEVWRGITRMPGGRRRRELERWFTDRDGPQAYFAGRILPFDDAAALIWAELMTAGEPAGRPRSPLDTLIAAAALAHDCVVVTDNTRDFAGVQTVNPMRL